MRKPALFRAAAAAVLLLSLAGCSGGLSGMGGVVPQAGVPTAGAAGADKAGPADAVPSAGATPAAAFERKIARTAQLTLAITDPAASAKAVRAAAEGIGGYVSSENVVTEQKDGFYVQASTVTVSVPSAKLDDALDALSKLGDVRSRVVTAADVTTQVVDLEARIKTKRESVARIEALMAKAGSITEIASVERELTTRQSELEAMVAQQQALADRVAMAPITVTLRPAEAVTSDPNPLLQGLASGWAAMLASARVLLAVLGALVPFVALGLAVWLPIRSWRRRRRPAALASTPLAPAPAEPAASVPGASVPSVAEPAASPDA